MDESFFALALLLIAWVLVLPGVLLFMVISMKRRIQDLESQMREVHREDMQAQWPPAGVNPFEIAPGAEPDEPPPLPPQSPAAPAFAQDRAAETTEDYAPHPAEAPLLHRIAAALRSVGLWPPSDARADREVLLLQWWLPRIGGLLAVLAALFFGAYVNQHANPLLRWLELAGTAVGISALGLFFERKRKAFGAVIFVTGLVLCYLASIAAYALPPVQIVHSAPMGAALQALALALIVGAGLVRRSSQIVNLAYAFSFFLIAFMGWTGLRDATYISAFFLLLVSPVLTHRFACRHLMWIAVPLAAVALLAFPLMDLWRTPLLPTPMGTLLYLQGFIALSFVLRLGSEILGRRLLALALSLALLAIFAVGRLYGADVLELIVGVSGLHLVLWSIAARWLQRPVAYELAFIKGCFLIAVWVILHWHGDLRWMVLALQALLMAVTYRSRPSIWIELTTLAALLASGVFYSEALNSISAFGSFLWWMMTIYPFVALLAASITAGVKAPQWADNMDAGILRAFLYGAVAILTTLAWATLAVKSQMPVDAALVLAIIPYACALMGLLPKLGNRYLPFASVGLTYIAANVVFLDSPFSLTALLLLAIISAAGAYLVKRRPESRQAQLIEGLLWLVFLPSLATWLEQALRNWNLALTTVFLLAAVLVLIGSLARLRMLGIASVILPVLFLALEPGASAVPLVELPAAFVWIATALYLPPLRDQKIWSFPFAATLLLAFLAQRLEGEQLLPWITWQATATVCMFLLFYFGKRRALWGLWWGGAGFLSLLLLLHHEAFFAASNWASDVISSAAFIIAPLTVINLWLGRMTHGFRQSLMDVVAALIVFEIVFLTADYPTLQVDHLLTPIAALTCFAIITFGIIRKNRPWRLTGLILLLIPLGRLFLVDVQDAFYRIIAFGMAALLFVLLGYIYHRIEQRLTKPA